MKCRWSWSPRACAARPRGSRSRIGDQVIVEEGRRITARHVRQLEEAKVKQLRRAARLRVRQGPRARRREHRHRRSARQGQRSAHGRVGREAASRPASRKIKTLYTNDLDRGPFISDTLRIDPTKTRLEALVEIYRMMRPGEPPTKDAAENLFNNLFFNDERYDLSAVGPHEVQPPRGPQARSRGAGVLSQARTSSTC